MATFNEKLQKPKFVKVVLVTAEIFVALAVCITIWSILHLHPVPLTLFIMVAQPFFIIGVVLYIIVTVSWFFSHHGTSQISYAKGETIFNEGDKAEFVYSIIQGNVEIVGKDLDGRENVIATLGPGDYFGEMAMASNMPRNATARALGSVKTMTIAKGDFINLHDNLPALRDNIDKVIQSRAAGLKTEET